MIMAMTSNSADNQTAIYPHVVAQNYHEDRRYYALAAGQGDAEATKALRRVDQVLHDKPLHQEEMLAGSKEV